MLVALTITHSISIFCFDLATLGTLNMGTTCLLFISSRHINARSPGLDILENMDKNIKSRETSVCYCFPESNN